MLLSDVLSAIQSIYNAFPEIFTIAYAGAVIAIAALLLRRIVRAGGGGGGSSVGRYAAAGLVLGAAVGGGLRNRYRSYQSRRIEDKQAQRDYDAESRRLARVARQATLQARRMRAMNYRDYQRATQSGYRKNRFETQDYRDYFGSTRKRSRSRKRY